MNNWNNNLFPNLWYYTNFFTLKVNKGEVLSVRNKRGQAGSGPLAAAAAGELKLSLEEAALADKWAMSALALLAIQEENENLPDV